MKLTVFAHKRCWRSAASPSGFATYGGFPFQMSALSELFDTTTLVVPVVKTSGDEGEIPLTGHSLSVAPLTHPSGQGLRRKLGLPWWLVRNGPTLLRTLIRAEAVHTPIPGDVGTFGMVLAVLGRKRLYVRHCGNWLRPRTAAERFWKGFMQRYAGGRNVMLATGGQPTPPSERNPNLDWIFSTSLTRAELDACARPRTAPSNGQVRLITVARQEWPKGTDVVLKSLPLLQNRFPNIGLDVVGEGGALPDFKQMAEQLGVNVNFHGRVDHEAVMDLLGEADVFCFPTAASEGFPKVVLEAMACGLPVVTTPVSVLPQLMGQGGGIMLNERTPEAIVEAVSDILGSPSRYRALSDAAVKTAQQYSLERWQEVIGDKLEAAWGALRSND